MGDEEQETLVATNGSWRNLYNIMRRGGTEQAGGWVYIYARPEYATKG